MGWYSWLGSRFFSPAAPLVTSSTVLTRMKLTLLRYLLMIDAAVLFLLGLLLIFAPAKLEVAFHFDALPPAVSYLIGLWGCVFVTLSGGYAIAATNPLQHVAWIQIAIARGVLECLLGLFYVIHGIVSWEQAAFGIIAAGCISFAYLVLYPRRRSLTLSHTQAAEVA